MEFFSTRNKILSINPNGLRSTSIQLRERIWNVFYKEEYDYYDTLEYTSYTTGIEDMMLEMGIKYEFPANKIYKNQNAEKLHKHVVQCEGMWYRIYDFIEKYLRVTDSEKTQRLTIEFNRILEEEVAPYRILNGLVVPIIGKSELNSISETIDLEYESVSKHMTKALELYSDRKKPDYENSVKESISSVESMCSIITGLSGGAATLGNTLKKLKENGVNIHPALENAFKQLYGYTSDSGGIRHGSIEFVNVASEDAKYMLPNISALMNTLMETDAKERVSKELLLEAIDDFEKDNIDSRECISEWKSKVAAETEMITKKAMKKILNMRTGIASKFNRFLHEKYGVWIDGELRKGEFEATYQIGNLLNIKYEYNEKDYLDGRTFVYYVGAKSKRLAYPNACCMRKVISLGEELEYEEALPLMAVEFVRNSQYTVLPFPFKYLREYIEQC